jgi:PAS domain S-box-containing protein
MNNNKYTIIEKLLLESTDILYIEISNGLLINSNNAFQNKFTRRIKDFNKQPISEILHPSDHENFEAIFKKLKIGDNNLKIEGRILFSKDKFQNLIWTFTYDQHTEVIYGIAKDTFSENELIEKFSKIESKFNLFFENSQIFMCMHDLQGNLININTAGAKILSCEKSEIHNYNVADFIHKKFLGEFKEYLISMPSIKTYSGQMPIIDKNGELHILLFRNLIVENLNMEPFIIGNAIDITEQYFLQNDLNKSRERLEQTNSLAKVGAWEFNLVKGTFYWSNLTKLIHEVPNDYTPTLEQTYRFYKDEHRIKMMSAIENATNHGIAYDIELQIVTAKNNYKWVRVQGNSEMIDGKCVRLYGAYQDINDRKTVEIEILKSRKLFDDVLKSAVEISIIATDINGLIILFNSGAEVLLGYKSEEVVNKHYLDFAHDNQEILKKSTLLSNKHKKKFSSIEALTYHARTKGMEQLECIYIHKNQHRILVSLVISPIYDVDNKITGYLGIAKDITEERKKLKELVESKKNAESANIAKSAFLANMSHEIRTPLNGIIGFTELVLKTDLDENQKQYLSIVNQSANFLLGAINDILDFSKIEAGKLDLNIEIINLYDTACQSLELITYQALTKGIEVILNISNNVPTFVFSDSIRLKQVLVNLLSNSVKFTNKGEIELHISIKEKISEEEMIIRFLVYDTGIGIPTEKQATIFEAFTQEDSSTTKKFGGTGLGLTIANRLLALMGSKLYLRSTVGKGSQFYFDLNLKVEATKNEELAIPSELKKVLIIDDHKKNRSILKELLMLNNIKTIEVSSGQEGITLLEKRNDFDLLIIDFELPEMDGLETIRRIRKLNNHSENLPKIILYHKTNYLDRINIGTEKYKIDFNLIKPIRKKELFYAINQIYNGNNLNNNYSNLAPLSSLEDTKILIVEDNIINMLLSKTMLKLSFPNAQIIEANNGIEAIEHFKNFRPNLILMDIQMSGMSGYTTTKEIRKLEHKSYTPIIALTAGNVKGEREKCLESGMDDFLSKPIIFSALSDCLTKWVPSIQIKANEHSEKHFNLETLKEIIGENQSVASDLIEHAKIELSNYKKILLSQIRNPNQKKYKSIAHKLYGMSTAFGMDTISELSKEIEVEEMTKKQALSHLNLLLEEIEMVINLL